MKGLFSVWETILRSVESMMLSRIGVVMLIDQMADPAGLHPGLKHLAHDRAEVRATAAVDQHRLVTIHDQIGVALQTPLAVGKPHPIDGIRKLDGPVIVDVQAKIIHCAP